MAEQAAELRRQLHLLGEQFKQRLHRELPKLQAQADSLRSCRDGAQRLQLLHTLQADLHKLAGSAGTFGFAALSQEARRLERQASAWLNAGQCDLANLPDYLSALHLLPQLAREQDETDAGLELLQGPEQPRQASGQQRIAILEDDEQSGRAIELTLKNFGYQASWYADTQQLDERLQQQDVDVLIVDVNLHNQTIDGLDYAQSLHLPYALPLLVISSRNDFTTQLRAVRAGAVGFLGKPINLPALENALQRVLSRQQGEPYRVLIVDDDMELANRYALVLRQHNMLVDVCHDPRTVLSRMAGFNPEVILLDVHMPQCNGTELAQIIRFNDEWLRVSIIYLSAEIDLSRQMKALLRAGDDFVTKPISDSALVTTVFSRAQRARQLSTALSRDSLTGLLKHADIKEQVSHEVARANRSNQPLSLVMLDIDHFKQINDRYGHPVGDNVIRSLANLLRQRLRKIDSLGRYGGEEFLAVLPDCSAEHATQLMNEIRRHFEGLRFPCGEQEFQCTFSAGVAQSEKSLSPGAVLERADQALYLAKRDGRNRVCTVPA